MQNAELPTSQKNVESGAAQKSIGRPMTRRLVAQDRGISRERGRRKGAREVSDPRDIERLLGDDVLADLEGLRRELVDGSETPDKEGEGDEEEGVGDAGRRKRGKREKNTGRAVSDWQKRVRSCSGRQEVVAAVTPQLSGAVCRPRRSAAAAANDEDRARSKNERRETATTHSA